MNVQKHNILRKEVERTETFTIYAEWINYLLQSCEEGGGWVEVNHTLPNITLTPRVPVIFPINEG